MIRPGAPAPNAVEIPIFDLIVHRWPAVRITLLVLGIWVLTWMFGLLCAYLMRPHTVGPEGIRARRHRDRHRPQLGRHRLGGAQNSASMSPSHRRSR
jgi:hypothetical protein